MSCAVLAVAWVCMSSVMYSVYVWNFFFPSEEILQISLFSSVKDTILLHWEQYNIKFAAWGAQFTRTAKYFLRKSLKSCLELAILNWKNMPQVTSAFGQISLRLDLPLIFNEHFQLHLGSYPGAFLEIYSVLKMVRYQ